MTPSLEQFLSGDRSDWAYLYSYPHKTAYRPFDERVPLERLWRDEPKDSLYLYAHIPFCASKCSFCNLLSVSRPSEGMVDRYLGALERQAAAVRESIGRASFSGYAIGGGTPSLLDTAQLERLVGMLRTVFGIDPARGGSFEASPDTLTPGKIRFLRQAGVERLSLGVQSFDADEARLLGRPRPDRALDNLLDAVAAEGFPAFNIDLIYGMRGQTEDSFRASVAAALRHAPTELFLYPLYVRPLTALHRREGRHDPEGVRIDSLLEAGRGVLLEAGYVQDSLRRFCRPGTAPTAASEYSCQEDGMVGLGAGARSYTRDVHYSTDWAVGRDEVEVILGDFLARGSADFARADHGIRLTLDDRKRRFLIKSVLKSAGLDLPRYRGLFGTDALQDFPDLPELLRLDLAVLDGDRLRLTGRGMALSDGVGAWFVSRRVLERMRELPPR